MKFKSFPHLLLFLLGAATLNLRADITQYRSSVQAEPSLLSFYPFDGDTAPLALDRVAPFQNGTLTGATRLGNTKNRWDPGRSQFPECVLGKEEGKSEWAANASASGDRRRGPPFRREGRSGC